jgi:hypothetical protein
METMYGYIFIKFSEAKFIDDMYQNEYLYFNKYSKFRDNNPGEKARFDPREGNLTNTQARDLELTINLHGGNVKLGMGNNSSAQFCEHLKDTPLISCSLFSALLTEGSNNIQVDERMRQFGDKALVILNHTTFWNMLDEALINDEKWYKRDFLELYDPRIHNGKLSYFHKDVTYEYLNEYRIIKQVDNAVPTIVYLPGLRSISMIADFDDIKEFTVNVSPK